MTTGGHRRNCDGAQKLVHLRRRDDDAGSGLLDFCANGRVEGREPNFAAADADNAPPQSRFRSRRISSPDQGFVFGVTELGPDERVVARFRNALRGFCPTGPRSPL
jgi:hypothetical protein